MKKGRLFFALLMAAILSCASVPMQGFAEEGAAPTETVQDAAPESTAQEESAPADDSQEDSETDTEHPSAYYDEITTNEIENWPQGEAIDSDAAIVMDAETGAILYAKNIEKQEYPASITKIMTVLLALEKGNLSDTVTFSENAVYSIEYNSSHLGMTAGEKLTLEQCLYGIMLASANEVSNAVAEHIGGDIDSFVDMMNEKAKELGCTNTHFVNANGLHDENHYVCAKDMALIMQAAVQNEKFVDIISTVEYHFPKTNLVDEERYFQNHHKMISEEGMLYDGCIGGKTGYTDEAGNTLVTYAERDGQKLITVVLKANGLYNAYYDTETLLNYGFDNFKNVEIPSRVREATVINGLSDEEEIAEIREKCVDSMTEPAFKIASETKVTLPNNKKAADTVRTLDFTANTLTYTYEGQTMGSTSFTYTGEWDAAAVTETESESETESGTAAEESTAAESGKDSENESSAAGASAAGTEDGSNAAETESGAADSAGTENGTADGKETAETPQDANTDAAAGQADNTANSSAAVQNGSSENAAKAVLTKVKNGAGFLYGKMDTFIKENTVASTVIGAVLLLVFVPALLVAVNRNRKYVYMMAQREQEEEDRRKLEAEIEAKSTDEVEAELREAEKEAQLEEEKKRKRKEQLAAEKEAAEKEAAEKEAAEKAVQVSDKDVDGDSAEDAEKTAEEAETTKVEDTAKSEGNTGNSKEKPSSKKKRKKSKKTKKNAEQSVTAETSEHDLEETAQTVDSKTEPAKDVVQETTSDEEEFIEVPVEEDNSENK